MTSTPNTPQSSYPTAWRLVDSLTGTEVRQTSDDTFQLRSAHSMMTINRVGFNLYRQSAGGIAAWHQWVSDNNIMTVPRDDL